MIDLTKTMLVINSHPKPYINHKTFAYFYGKGLPTDNLVAACHQRSVVEARNTNALMVKANLENFDWFIFMDQDNWPTHRTDPFLDDVPFDVVGCNYEVGNPNTWSYPDAFHMGCVRVRSSVLRGLELPWFMFEYVEDGSKISKCECNYFRDLLLEKGATITRRGICEHDNEHSWHGA